MRSQRQPSVGITTTARSTSNTVPRAQNTWKTENQQKNEDKSAPKASSLEHSRLCSAGMAGERNSRGANSALKYSKDKILPCVTLTHLEEDVELNLAPNLWSCQLSKSITEMSISTKSWIPNSRLVLTLQPWVQNNLEKGKFSTKSRVLRENFLLLLELGCSQSSGVTQLHTKVDRQGLAAVLRGFPGRRMEGM